MKAFRALILVLVLSVCASAGNMPTCVTGNMPTDVAGNMDNGVAGNMQNDAAGNVSTGIAGNIPCDAADPITEIALNLFQSVLALF